MTHGPKHLAVAGAISLATAAVLFFTFGVPWLTPGAALTGAFFYIGREIRDLEKSHGWNLRGMDWAGLLWPVIPLFAFDTFLRVW